MAQIQTIMTGSVGDPVVSVQVATSSRLHDDVLHVSPRQQWTNSISNNQTSLPELTQVRMGHQHENIGDNSHRSFTGNMPFLLPNQQC